MDELKELKKILESHRLANPKLRKFPDPFWTKIIQLSKKIPSRKIANFLNINAGNINRRIREIESPEVFEEKFPSQQFIQIPVQPSGSGGKQIVLNLPHNITIRIDV